MKSLQTPVRETNYCPLVKCLPTQGTFNVFKFQGVLGESHFASYPWHSILLLLLLSCDIKPRHRFPQWRINDHKIWHVWGLRKRVLSATENDRNPFSDSNKTKYNNCFGECATNPFTYVSNSHHPLYVSMGNWALLLVWYTVSVMFISLAHPIHFNALLWFYYYP